jgi:UDP-glucose 4-epimerase
MSDATHRRYAKEPIAIIGGTGFLGGALARRATAEGHAIATLSRNPGAAASGIRRILGDFRDEVALAQVLAGAEICVHALSCTYPGNSNDNIAQDIETNLLGTIRLLNGCVKHGVKRIIFLSSGGTVYGVPREVPISETHETYPISSYGIVKLAIENYIRLLANANGLSYAIARIANPYGGIVRKDRAQGVIPVFIEKILAGQTLTVMGDGSVVRDYLYIDDTIDAVYRLCRYQGQEAIVNIGAGVGMSIREVIQAISQEMNVNPVIDYRPARAVDVPVNILNIDRAYQLLGWRPTTSLRDGIQLTLRALSEGKIS